MTEAEMFVKAKELYPFQQKDHLAWAKRIIWKLEQGDKSLSMIQINFAKEALGIDQQSK